MYVRTGLTRPLVVFCRRGAAASTIPITFCTPKGEELPGISINFVKRPLLCRPAVVATATVKGWRSPNQTVAAPQMLVVRLQHLAVRAAFNWFEEFTYGAHGYNYRRCAGWDGFALLSPEGIVCFRGAGNVCNERHSSVGWEWLELHSVGHGDWCDDIHS